VHHTDCGMETFTDEIMRGLLASSLTTATVGPDGWKDPGGGGGSEEAEFIDWLTIRDREESVETDVRRIRNHPLVPPEIPVHGFLFDVATGRLHRVETPVRFEKVS